MMMMMMMMLLLLLLLLLLLMMMMTTTTTIASLQPSIPASHHPHLHQHLTGPPHPHHVRRLLPPLAYICSGPPSQRHGPAAAAQMDVSLTPLHQLSMSNSPAKYRYFVNMPGYTTAQQYASAIGDLKAIAAACCSALVKTCCDRPFYVKFLTGRYTGRV
jgi:hypothetical protein